MQRLLISQKMNTTYHLLILLLLFYTILSHCTNYYEHIIIGAGIAGIAASMELSNHSLPHLIIQARDRIGGRIATFEFGDSVHEMGAAFIQIPHQKNLIDPYVSLFDLSKIPANFLLQTAWYDNKTLCQTKALQPIQQNFKSLLKHIYKQANISQIDKPVSTIVNKFWKKNPKSQDFIKDRLSFQMQIIAIDNGAELETMSTLQFFGTNGTEYSNDYVPENGYSSFINTMFENYCKADIHFQQKVSKIDYSGLKITVTTTLDTYVTNKLFIAVPLGVLKAQQIEFVPALPKDKSDALDAIGVGLYEKLFVVFSQPFWPSGSSTLHFMSKNNKNRYAQAWVVPPQLSHNENLLIFWVSGDLAKELTTWSLDDIRQDLIDNLKNFIPDQIEITKLFITDWQHDPLTLGGFSYAKVGTKQKHFKDMKTVMKQGKNRIWFIGEYVDDMLYSFTHGAFRSGLQAAKESLKL